MQERPIEISLFHSRFAVVLCGVMAVCLGCFVAETFHWPLVGDSTMVHYLIFLMRHGMAPYRDIVDAQMPGTYLYDWLVVQTFGGDARGLRFFDFFLMAAGIAAMVAITWPKADAGSVDAPGDERYAGFLAGGLFALFHGRDGVEQGGQRDLIMAVLLLFGYAAAFHALRRSRPWLMGLSACIAVTAISIKPTVLPAAFMVLLLAALQLYRTRRRVLPYLAAALAGALLPALAVLLFLAHERAFTYFVKAVRGMWPYYATLGRRPTGYLVVHSFSPLQSVAWLGLVVVILRIAIVMRKRSLAPRGFTSAWPQFDWEHCALYLGLLLSLISVTSQGKGYPYHRYPFLAFLTLILLLEFNHAMRWKGPNPLLGWGRMYRIAGVLGLTLTVLFLAPVSTYKIRRFDWRNDSYYQSLSRDLARAADSLRGPDQPSASTRDILSRHIQCLDDYAGCVNTLYRMGLVESTGFTVDYYFWRPVQNAVTEEMRQRFWNSIEQNPPRVFVVTSQWFPGEGARGENFDKLSQWQLFDAYLTKNYSLFAGALPPRVLWSSHSERSYGYRIYVRKP